MCDFRTPIAQITWQKTIARIGLRKLVGRKSSPVFKNAVQTPVSIGLNNLNYILNTQAQAIGSGKFRKNFFENLIVEISNFDVYNRNQSIFSIFLMYQHPLFENFGEKIFLKFSKFGIPISTFVIFEVWAFNEDFKNR